MSAAPGHITKMLDELNLQPIERCANWSSVLVSQFKVAPVMVST